MAKHEIDKILTDREYLISHTRGIGGILARLYRTILRDLNMRPSLFQTLLYTANIQAKEALSSSMRNNNISSTRIAKYFTPGNLRRELEQPEMTFKVFMKGLRLLQVKKVKFSVQLTLSNGKETVHATEVDLGEIQNDFFALDLAPEKEVENAT